MTEIGLSRSIRTCNIRMVIHIDCLNDRSRILDPAKAGSLHRGIVILIVGEQSTGGWRKSHWRMTILSEIEWRFWHYRFSAHWIAVAYVITPTILFD